MVSGRWAARTAPLCTTMARVTQSPRKASQKESDNPELPDAGKSLRLKPLMKSLITFLLILFAFTFGCNKKPDSSVLLHTFSNQSSATLTLRYQQGAVSQLLDSVFVLSPGELDTLVFYEVDGGEILAPNCGSEQLVSVTVSGGRTLVKSPSDPTNWTQQIDQENGESSCVFVVNPQDIQ